MSNGWGILLIIACLIFWGIFIWNRTPAGFEHSVRMEIKQEIKDSVRKYQHDSLKQVLLDSITEFKRDSLTTRSETMDFHQLRKESITKEHFTVLLYSETLQDLRKIARDEDVRISQIVRDCLDKFVFNYNTKKQKEKEK
jgi:stress-induced morphogen